MPAVASEQDLSRRRFLGSGLAAGAGWALGPGAAESAGAAQEASPAAVALSDLPLPPLVQPVGLDLAPARWIWYPSGRTLPNTVVLFRRTFELEARPSSARGTLLADSRYVLFVNGGRVQAGPAPSDPRWPEADSFDIAAHLVAGRNAVGILVLYYGFGEGTWPAGKPGLVARLDIEGGGAGAVQIVTNASWQAHLSRAWRPGQYKRWYLRSLQEDFDARLHPDDWAGPADVVGGHWLPAMELRGSAARPSIATAYPDYLSDTHAAATDATAIVPRSIPLLVERHVPVARLADHFAVRWVRASPEEYFDVLVPDAYEVRRTPVAAEREPGVWSIARPPDAHAVALTFELGEQVVGWPGFTIDAPEGTIVELMVHEGHQVGGPAPLLNTHFHSWTRFTCRAGTNRFGTLDFESLRWLQLHIRSAGEGPVSVRDVHVRRRLYPFAREVAARTGEAPLDRLLSASVNTILNAAQDTIVDGMGRERQQYSGDIGHALHALHHAFGERRQTARFIRTYSQGLTSAGYFLDSWPAYDRLARLAQREMGLTPWGPLIDHSVGFTFDCFHQWMYTGDTDAVEEAFPRLVRFFVYLRTLRRADGLLPVEDLGVPWIWIDHDAYVQQRHKQCAFNLYASAMARYALAPLCLAFGQAGWADQATRFADEVLAAAVRRFWSEKDDLFVVNKPWLGGPDEPGRRLCDRSLATAVLFNQLPGGVTGPALDALERVPPDMGFSYPANAGWRLWALAHGGRIAAVLKDLRERWASLDSVRLNNTLQEGWEVRPDSNAQWSHLPVAPLYVLYMSIAGINPTAPGFERYEIRPQLGDLEHLHVTSYAAGASITVDASGTAGARTLVLTTPPERQGTLWLDEREEPDLPAAEQGFRRGLRGYRLPRGRRVEVPLRVS
jgi:alpha-L-rhamnosidase